MIFRRIIENFNDLSIRIKVTAGIAIPLVIFLTIITIIDYNDQQRSVFTNLSILASNSNQIIENSILHEMVNRDIQGLQEMLNEIAKDPIIRGVYLLNPSGKIVFAPNEENVGVVLENSDPTCRTCHNLKPEKRPGSVVVNLADGQRIFRSMVAVENRRECFECHKESQRIIGLLLTDIWMAPLETPLKAGILESISWRIATVLIVLIVVNLILNKFVLSRLEDLSYSVSKYRRDSIDINIQEKNKDEIGRLGIAFQEMGIRINQEANENRLLSENLRKQSIQRGKLLNRLTSAQEEERKRIARDIHDEFGQFLSGLSLKIEYLDRLIPDGNRKVAIQMEEVRKLLTQATDQVHELIFSLRPSILDDIGLVAALKAYLIRIKDEKGIHFELDATNLSTRLQPAIEVALYRIFQEAINNAIKHSNPKTIWIQLVASDGIFHGEIKDDGGGFDLKHIQLQDDIPVGFGLLGMKERVTQFNGIIEIFSQTGNGTCLRIHLPMDEVFYE